MQAADVMTREVTTVRAEATVAEALWVMLDRGVSGLPVIDITGTLVGIVTERDFLRRGADPETRAGCRVDDVMTTPVVTVFGQTLLEEAARLMARRRLKRLPVMDGDRIVGILSQADVLRALAEETATDASIPDATIRHHIAEQIHRDIWNPRATFEAVVREGVVDLRGIICDEPTRADLKAHLASIPGVKKVRDYLTTIELLAGLAVRPAPVLNAAPARPPIRHSFF
ncbi:MAG: CBS domain-containing protein [Nevskia sp.]|nr:CBS domain-containing protein [Nevskia sp.]